MPESYSLFPYFLENHGRILFLVSLLFVALMDPFDPYSPFKFLLILLKVSEANDCASNSSANLCMLLQLLCLNHYLITKNEVYLLILKVCIAQCKLPGARVNHTHIFCSSFLVFLKSCMILDNCIKSLHPHYHEHHVSCTTQAF